MRETATRPVVVQTRNAKVRALELIVVLHGERLPCPIYCTMDTFHSWLTDVSEGNLVPTVPVFEMVLLSGKSIERRATPLPDF